jgi:hypothetical protein
VVPRPSFKNMAVISTIMPFSTIKELSEPLKSYNPYYNTENLTITIKVYGHCNSSNPSNRICNGDAFVRSVDAADRRDNRKSETTD